MESRGQYREEEPAYVGDDWTACREGVYYESHEEKVTMLLHEGELLEKEGLLRNLHKGELGFCVLVHAA